MRAWPSAPALAARSALAALDRTNPEVQPAIATRFLLVPEVAANPTHYGDAATGCGSVVQALQVQGVTGDSRRTNPEG